MCGHVEASRYLLENGADPDIKNNLGETALHQASDNSLYKIAQLLLEFKADPNCQQNDGDTPLHHAAYRGDLSMVQILLQAGASPNIPNYIFGRTALHFAVDCGYLDIVKEMLKHGADSRIRDKQGKKAAILAHDKEIVELLSKVDETQEDRILQRPRTQQADYQLEQKKKFDLSSKDISKISIWTNTQERDKL